MSFAVPNSFSPDECAARWVARQDVGLSAAEEGELKRWLADSPAHRAAYERYSALMNAVGRPKRTGGAAELASRLARLAQKRRRRRAALGSVAIFCVVAVLGFIGWPDRSAGDAPTAAVTATLLLPQQQLLPDGTRVEYPEGAQFAVDFTGKVRRVRLTKGEAIFSVAKRPDWPFVVEAGGVEFRAVGTAFAVQLRADAAELVVTEGRVAVERAGTPLLLSRPDSPEPAAQIVEAGSRVAVALERSFAVAGTIAKVSDSEVGERLAWRHPRAEFSGAPLREIVELLNRQNTTKLELADEKLADVQVSGVFRTNDLNSLVRALELGFDVRAERGNGEIRLYRLRR